MGSLTPEEKYFQEKEAELRRKVREEAEGKAEEARAKRKLAEHLGTDDQALIDRLHALGLDGAVAPVLHLMPLVEVAWADGSISKNERASIMEAVEAHGVEPGSEAAKFMASLLETRPSDTLLEEILSVLKELLAARGLQASSILEACEAVAGASGGLLGLGDKVSDEERAAIERIAGKIDAEAARKITEQLD